MDSIIAIISPWYASIATLLFFLLIRFIYRKFLLTILHSLTSRTSFTYFKDLLEAFAQPINIVILITGIYMAIHVAPLDIGPYLPLIDHTLRTVVILCFFMGCYNIYNATHGLFIDLLANAGIRSNESLSDIFYTILHILIVLLGFITVTKEWDYDISAFIASLGIGSMAMAFAAKGSLANVFGSRIIILEKPFTIGDWILADDVESTVEKSVSAAPASAPFPRNLSTSRTPCCPTRPSLTSPAGKNAAWVSLWA
ncbi:MAG: mechanosensitive ion channel family protein [Phascolarctobacterium sp.]|nr:mechanosensitive ion channel family protein [Phascolarctobacterium sp.]